MLYRQDIAIRTPITHVKLITISIVTIRSIWLFWHNSADDFLRVGKFLANTCQSCGATYRRICEMFSALQSTSVSVTDVENSVQIDA